MGYRVCSSPCVATKPADFRWIFYPQIVISIFFTKFLNKYLKNVDMKPLQQYSKAPLT